MGLREDMAYAIASGNLTQDPLEETAADMIGALARADKLGSLLWRVTGNLDAGAFREARSIVVGRLCATHPTVRPSIITGVVQQAMQEWLAMLCHTCGGRMFITNADGVREKCIDCQGTGRGRYSDADRMEGLHVGEAAYLQLIAIFDETHKMLADADKRVTRDVARQLGRRTPMALKIQGKQ